MRIRKKDDDDVTLEMSPLIDCVFLLLIFFLITTMMKKLEKQIPIEVPDPDVTISERMDARRVILAIGKDGRYYSAERRLQDGRPDFRAVGDVDKFVENLGRMTQGAGEEINVRLYADPDVEFQTVIDMLDKLQINHLNKVDVRMRDYRESRFYIPGSSD
jgi:biopolymer transport protein ExbD